MTKDKIYYSKIDVWLVCLCALISAGVPVFAYLHGAGIEDCAHIFFADCFVIPVAIWLGFSKYFFGANCLEIRCGIFPYAKIPYRQILDFAPSRNPSSAPALSLDRISIRLKAKISVMGIFKTDAILVSPQRKEDFIADLRAKIGDAQDACQC